MTYATALDDHGCDLGSEPRREEPSASCDTVLVYERSSDLQALLTLVGHLNCTPVSGRIPLPDATSRPRAAIISDAIDDAIDLCSSLPRDLPKVLIASKPTFAFRCAAARAGAEAILERPIDLNDLSGWLECFRSRETPEPISVLLIDDHVLTAELHATVLRRAGIAVTVVLQPTDVLAALEAVTPDLVLMDIQMPGVDGIELAKIIRQSREYLSIPIAFLSAESDEGRKMVARQCGGDDFISKPVDLMQLAGHVRLRAERARTLRSLIDRDSLTGLLNYGAFRERVAVELDRSRRTGSALALGMLDLDHFKIVNDTHGHPVGDKVLRTLARVLAGRLRATDIVGRYGGEEFGVLLLDTTLDAARDVIDGVRQQFKQIIFDEPSGSFSATFSAGVADSQGMSTPMFFSVADEALYQAKRQGRDIIRMAAQTPRPVDDGLRARRGQA